MATLTKSFKSLNEKMEEFEKKFQEEGSALFKEICTEVFEKFPEVNSFSWTQYTPYFNDGDECTFSVNSIDEVNGYSEYDDDKEGGEGFNPYAEYSYRNKENRSYEIISDLNSFVSSAPENVLRALFGDHAHVTVYRDKDAVSEHYEHE